MSIILTFFLLSSCIKDEPLYREAYIEAFDLGSSMQVEALDARDGLIVVIVSDTTGMYNKRFAPKLVISPGATVFPASGDSVDFDNYVARYTVTSEDKKYTNEFYVNLVPMVPLETGFEEWTTAGGGILKYPVLVDNLWSSANGGIALATMGKIGEYPTRSTTDSHSGNYAAMLETKKGDKYWGQNIPIFSGSLFRGKFTLDPSNFVRSAQFGQIHPDYMGKPAVFEGYYKYKPGEIFIDENGVEVGGRIDECSIHSVLYRIDKGDTSKESYLTGENILTSDKIVAKAVLADGSAKESFTRFEIPFIYTKELDYENYDYRLAVVFASSKEGDFYRGAVGSTLIVDDVRVLCTRHK